MKKLLLCTLTFISMFIAHAQNIAPFWSLAGNNNASETTSRLGTTNYIPLRFFTNSLERMRINANGNVGIGVTVPIQKLHVAGNININTGFGLYLNNLRFLSTPGTQNLYLGYHAGESNSGLENLFVGHYAGQTGNGSRNTIVGFKAGMKTAGANNAFYGYYTGTSNTSGAFNSFFGNVAGFSNTTGRQNSFLGNEAGYSNTTGINNVAIGNSALRRNIDGSNLVAIGDFALFSQLHTRDEYLESNLNTAVGTRALYANTAGFGNTAVGMNSLTANVSGEKNTANGAEALSGNTGGEGNSAFGYQSLRYNEIGVRNTAVGSEAMYDIIGSDNVAVGSHSLAAISGTGNTAVGSGAMLGYSGFKALQSFTNGNYNTAIGYQALTTEFFGSPGPGPGEFDNRIGDYNVAVGGWALYLNDLGYSNTALGTDALYNNTIGHNSVAVGDSAGYANITGFNNTFVGDHSNANAGNYSNSTGLGSKSQITASNQVRIGNNTITSIGGYVDWTNISDARLKENIKDNVPGLEFINQLQPVTYNLKLTDKNTQLNKAPSLPQVGKIGDPLQEKNKEVKEKEKIVYTGFLAQDVEKAAKKIDYDFSGVDAPKNDKDYYGLRYAQFVVPLVKSVQQLDSANKAKDERISKLEQEMIELREIIKGLDGGHLSSGKAWMKQNTPNPVSGSTSIQFSIPEDVRSAKIVITNSKGQQLKFFNVNGEGSVNFYTGTLPSGTYNYTLVTDGKTIITKKLVIAR